MNFSINSWQTFGRLVELKFFPCLSTLSHQILSSFRVGIIPYYYIPITKPIQALLLNEENKVLYRIFMFPVWKEFDLAQ